MRESMNAGLEYNTKMMEEGGNPVQSVWEASTPHARLWLGADFVALVALVALGYAWFSGSSRISQNERELRASVFAFNQNALNGAVTYADNVLARNPSN